MKKRIITGWMLSLSIVSGFAADRVGSTKDEAKPEEVWDVIRQQENGPPAVSPLPTDVQLKYHHLEKQMFIHFKVNNFTGREWGDGKVYYFGTNACDWLSGESD